jgi:hypothetical protein
LIKTGFKVYNLDRDLIDNYRAGCTTNGDASLNYDNCRITGDLFNLTAFQTFDMIMALKP